MKRSILFIFIGILLAASIFAVYRQQESQRLKRSPEQTNNVLLSGSFDPNRYRPDSEWRSMLTSEQYRILREKGTEIPFTGALNHEDRAGTYYSVGCDEPVFRSEQKFDSGTGWPSFDQALAGAIMEREDNELGMRRTEIVCANCGSHLGHVFDDGPTETGKRYCLNSVCLDLEAK